MYKAKKNCNIIEYKISDGLYLRSSRSTLVTYAKHVESQIIGNNK